MKKSYKRLLSVFLTFSLVFALSGVVFAADDPYFSAGSGATEDPFLLLTPEDLMTLSDIIRTPPHTALSKEWQFYTSAYYKVAVDIDMAGYDWIPIGFDMDHIFKGDFNGNYKTISNLTSITTTSGVSKGLFAWMGGKVYNLTLKNVDFQSRPSSTVAGIGGVAGVLYNRYEDSVLISTGVIENCHVTGVLTVGTDATSNGRNVGGIAGASNGPGARISDSTFNGDIIAINTTASYLGGIVGYIDQSGLTVEKCYSSGSITRPEVGGRYIGKIAGGAVNTATMNSVTFTEDYTTMIVNAASSTGIWSGYDGIEGEPPVDPGEKTGIGVRYDDGAVAIKDANRLAVATLWVKADSGTPEFAGLNNFTVLNSALVGDQYRVTLGYLVSGGAGFTSEYAGLVTISGATGVEIVRARFSGYDENGVAVDMSYYLDKETGGGVVIPPDDPPVDPPINYDLNGDGVVDQLDLAIALGFYMVNGGDATWNSAKIADFNKDGIVDIEDFIRLLNNMTW